MKNVISLHSLQLLYDCLKKRLEHNVHSIGFIIIDVIIIEQDIRGTDIGEI